MKLHPCTAACCVDQSAPAVPVAHCRHLRELQPAGICLSGGQWSALIHFLTEDANEATDPQLLLTYIGWRGLHYNVLISVFFCMTPSLSLSHTHTHTHTPSHRKHL